MLYENRTPWAEKIDKMVSVHKRWWSWLSVMFAVTVTHQAQAAEPPFAGDRVYDLVIRDGLVVDGSGQVPRRASVVISDGAIVHVGKISPSLKASQDIDATDLVVTPGFIDAHAHSNPSGPGHHAHAMGVTTIVVGQDGRSPTNGDLRPWIGRLRQRRLALNVVPFVGHGTARKLARIRSHKRLSEAALARLGKVVDGQMRAGAFGLSTALEYTPGRFAASEELKAIAQPVAKHGGLIMSHLRSEDEDQIDDAVNELITQGRTSGAAIHIAHLKIVYGKGPARADALLARLAKARSQGLRITADVYPYTASYTGTAIVFPAFAKPPHNYRKVVRTRRAELADFVRRRVKRRGGPGAMLLGTGRWRGQTLEQIARQTKKPFENVLIDDLGLYGASAAHFVMDRHLQDRLLLADQVMIGSDGSAGTHHPRGHGTFARIIERYVVKQKQLSLERAVFKMTGLPARTLGLTKRGRLAAGQAADVLVFNPTQIRERASYAHPQRPSEGMLWVFVGGRAAIANGKVTRARGGRLLLRHQK